MIWTDRSVDKHEISEIMTRREDWVLQQWDALCCDIGVTRPLAINWREIIRSSYSEHGRHYHTLNHLADLLESAERDFDSFRNPRVVRLAIFFHDIIYDPKSGTNEEDSETLFKTFAEEARVNHSEARAVSAYIIATKKHDVSGSDDSDLCAFIDLDMGVIGRERPDYLTYASQIRREYSHVPTETFCRKRAEILRQFLAAGSIYATDQYRKEREPKARANMEAEIALLDQGDLAALEQLVGAGP